MGVYGVDPWLLWVVGCDARRVAPQEAPSCRRRALRRIELAEACHASNSAGLDWICLALRFFFPSKEVPILLLHPSICHIDGRFLLLACERAAYIHNCFVGAVCWDASRAIWALACVGGGLLVRTAVSRSYYILFLVEGAVSHGVKRRSESIV